MVVLAVVEGVRFDQSKDRIWIARDAIDEKWKCEGLCLGRQRPAWPKDYTWEKMEEVYLCQSRAQKTNFPESFALF